MHWRVQDGSARLNFRTQAAHASLNGSIQCLKGPLENKVDEKELVSSFFFLGGGEGASPTRGPAWLISPRHQSSGSAADCRLSTQEMKHVSEFKVGVAV